MIAFNSTCFYLIVCYAHMKIFLLYMRNITFIFIISPIFRKGFTSSRINYYPNSVANYQATLLLRSGDFGPNPGTCVTDLHNLSAQRNFNFNGLSTFYANALSIVNKRNKLEIDTAASRYDIITLTETHLDYSISDSEVLLNNYLIFRRDRKSNGRHRGDVLIAVRDHIKAIPRESLQSESEFIFVDILFPNNRKITFGVFYRPPNSETKPLEVLQTALQKSARGMI